MTDQPKTALDQFLATADRLKAILKDHSAVSAARRMPEVAERRMGEVSIRAEQPYYNRSPEPETVAAAKEVHSRLKAQLIAAAELTSIRMVLPNLAAKAAIELGVTSRELFAEAQEGSQS